MHDIEARHAGALLEIDLGAVRANYRLLRARLGAAACAGVVKADAYGLGAARVAPALAAESCRHFFVAHLDEAIALRPALPGSAEVLVLNGLPYGAEAEAAAWNITPVLNSPRQLDAWAAAARRCERRLPAALRVDSGLSRLGLDAAEVATLADAPARLASLDLRLVMSHLACAEDPAHPMNRAQLHRFAAARCRLPPAPDRLANSSGVFLCRDFYFDLARPGAALYGLAPVKGAANPMQPAVRLLGRIVQTREIPAGPQVGYGANWTAACPRRVATVAVGYADGYRRSLSHRATAHAGETPVPLVGIVSMDTATFDFTEAPQAVESGLLELVGPRHPVDALAAKAGTIGYEILTSLGGSYARAYADASQIEGLSA